MVGEALQNLFLFFLKPFSQLTIECLCALSKYYITQWSINIKANSMTFSFRRRDLFRIFHTLWQVSFSCFRQCHPSHHTSYQGWNSKDQHWKRRPEHSQVANEWADEGKNSWHCWASSNGLTPEIGRIELRRDQPNQVHASNSSAFTWEKNRNPVEHTAVLRASYRLNAKINLKSFYRLNKPRV